MTNLFGHERVTKTGDQTASSQYAIIVINEALSLAANFQATLRQDIQPFLPIGEPAIYFLRGVSSGNVSVETLVGADGFFKQLRSAAAACGRVDGLSVNLTGGKCTARATGKADFEGGLIQSATISMREGNLQVRQGFELLVADLQLN